MLSGQTLFTQLPPAAILVRRVIEASEVGHGVRAVIWGDAEVDEWALAHHRDADQLIVVVEAYKAVAVFVDCF
jgi:hypothetical protein